MDLMVPKGVVPNCRCNNAPGNGTLHGRWKGVPIGQHGCRGRHEVSPTSGPFHPEFFGESISFLTFLSCSYREQGCWSFGTRQELCLIKLHFGVVIETLQLHHSLTTSTLILHTGVRPPDVNQMVVDCWKDSYQHITHQHDSWDRPALRAQTALCLD